MYGELVRKIVSVPANHTEGLKRIDILVDAILLFDLDQKVSLFIVCFQLKWRVHVPFAKRGMLLVLPEPIAIALGRIDRALGFDYEQAILFRLKIDLIDRASRDHQIIPVRELYVTQHGPQFSAPLVNKDHLVRIGVLVKILPE
jgi:hypothetical protein